MSSTNLVLSMIVILCIEWSIVIGSSILITTSKSLIEVILYIICYSISAYNTTKDTIMIMFE